jgi:hypothetical protein
MRRSGATATSRSRTTEGRWIAARAEQGQLHDGAGLAAQQALSLGGESERECLPSIVLMMSPGFHAGLGGGRARAGGRDHEEREPG